MKIAIFEYITGGGFRETDLPEALAHEGDKMIRALARDLSEVAGIEFWVPRDDRLPPLAGARCLPVRLGDGYQAAWNSALMSSDAGWPIAPETCGLLENLCTDVERIGKPLLTSPSPAVRTAASKLTTTKVLAAGGVPVTPTFPALETPTELPFPRICKPDDGVGCEGLAILSSWSDWTTSTPPRNWVVQPLLEGDAISLSVLFAQGRSRLLSCNRQHIVPSERGLRLIACEVNAMQDDHGHWQTLADQVAQAMPGLWGYAGIDLILTSTGPQVLEVNPRLTSSYAGIRPSTGENPAAMVLDLIRTGQLPERRQSSASDCSIIISLEGPNHEH